MSSRRRDRSRSPRSRLRMDSYSTKTGRSKVSPPRSREIDSVMKRARRSDSQSTYWNKKLLEAEEKDPNRSPRRNSRARSPRKARSPRSPRKESRGRSPRDSRARSPRRDSRGRSPRARSPRRDSTLRAVRRDSRGRSPGRSRSLVMRARTPRARTPRSPRSRSPRVRRRSPPRQVHHRQGRSADSNSSDTSSSCSDESCSVCSPKRKTSKERPRPKEPPPERKREVVHYRPPPFMERSRSRSFSVPRSKPPPPVVEKVKTKKSKKADKSAIKVNRAHIKREKHDSDSESSSGRGSTVDIVSSMAGPKLSLSERFGRMAQWSVDRDLEHRNLRITSGDRLTVEMDSPPSPLYPPSLSSIAEMGGSWDDVRVRYAYYKERGYLRDLTLSDYIKWEQWWYKYQDWLDSDRSRSRYH
uniref:Neurofilament heavy polypeptide n=2 Tax=Lygus hesperus TaxID=30085 RepID=A0A0A9VWQ0_LYGHE